jgi:betaine reductase
MPDHLNEIRAGLQSFSQAVAYPPNQTFIGNLDPAELQNRPQPWYQHLVSDASRWGSFGEIMPESEFCALLKICDVFKVIGLDQAFVRESPGHQSASPFHETDIERLGDGLPLEEIHETLKEDSIPLFVDRDRLVGYCRRPQGDGAEEDDNLAPEIILENLSNRASGVMALRNLIQSLPASGDIEYLLGCGEEAVGDRYNRGGGNMAKAIGEMSGCPLATGADVKAFCCAPVHAMVLASGLVASGIFGNVAVIAGGSLAKLGMKYQGHLKHKMPILEDTVAGIAILVGPNDGESPVIRLDTIGRHQISSGSSQQAILEKLVVEPLSRRWPEADRCGPVRHRNAQPGTDRTPGQRERPQNQLPHHRQLCRAAQSDRQGRP